MSQALTVTLAVHTAVTSTANSTANPTVTLTHTLTHTTDPNAAYCRLSSASNHATTPRASSSASATALVSHGSSWCLPRARTHATSCLDC